MDGAGGDDARTVLAPALREVAAIWWDVDRDPAVTWDADGRVFDLVDPDTGSGGDRAPGPDGGSDDVDRLALVRFAQPVAAPRAVAMALADGLAACDFPPTGDGVAPARAATTLRVAGVTERPVDDG